MKLQSLAAPLVLADAKLAEPVVHRQQLAVVEAGKVRVDAGMVGHVQQAVVGPQAQRARQVDFTAFKTEVATFERAQSVADLAVSSRCQLDRDGLMFEAQATR